MPEQDLEQESQTRHGNDVLEPSAELGVRGRRDDLGGEGREEVVDLQPELRVAGHANFQAGAHAQESGEVLSLGQQREIAQRLEGGFGSGAAIDLDAAARGYEGPYGGFAAGEVQQ